MSTDLGAIQSPGREHPPPVHQAAAARLYRWGSYLFLALSALLFLLGLVLTTRVGAVMGLGGGEPLLLDASMKSFGETQPLAEVALTFTFTNRSARAVNVVGGTFGCGPHGCIWVGDDQLPLEIPPGQSRPLVVKLKAVGPGDFQQDLTLYTDCPGRPRLVLTLCGRVAAPTGA